MMNNNATLNKLISDLQSNHWDVRRDACYRLGQLKDTKAVEPLIMRLEDRSYKVRMSACYALADIGDKRAVEPLIARLGDDSSDVRSSACRALNMIFDILKPIADEMLCPECLTRVVAKEKSLEFFELHITIVVGHVTRLAI